MLSGNRGETQSVSLYGGPSRFRRRKQAASIASQLETEHVNEPVIVKLCSGDNEHAHCDLIMNSYVILFVFFLHPTPSKCITTLRQEYNSIIVFYSIIIVIIVVVVIVIIVNVVVIVVCICIQVKP